MWLRGLCFPWGPPGSLGRLYEKTRERVGKDYEKTSITIITIITTIITAIITEITPTAT